MQIFRMAYGALMACTILQPPLRAQVVRPRFRIALDITESTGGLFWGALSNSLRSIPDVDIVADGEPADYKWRLVVLCDGEGREESRRQEKCDQAMMYHVNYSLLAPGSTNDAWTAAFFALHSVKELRSLPRAKMDSLVDVATDSVWAASSIRNMERSMRTGVLAVGKSRYEQYLSDMVKKFNTSCLERRRLSRRLYPWDALPEEERKAIRAQISSLPESFCP